jgi:predicted transcriptional regulator
MHGMTRTMTIRLSGPARRRVHLRARALGITPSALIRAVLEEQIGAAAAEPGAFALTRRWIGSVRSGRVAAGREARRELDGWNPDRRG